MKYDVTGTVVWEAPRGVMAAVHAIFDCKGAADMRTGRYLATILFLGVAVAAAVPAWSGVYLVKDIATQSYGGGPDSVFPAADWLYFTAGHPVYGTELWRTDGTGAGTRMLRDINPTGSSDPLYFAEFGGLVYFVAADESRQANVAQALPGQEIWRTDGSPEGTVRVIDFADLESEGFPSELTVMGNHIYFASDAFGLGDELWRTDGTAEGTEMVKDISTAEYGSLPEQLTAAGNTLFFTADDGVHGRELWRSGGAAGTTAMVADIDPDGTWDIFEITAFGTDVLFWVRDPATGWHLWRSDGTADGTAPIHSMGFDSARRRPGTIFVHNGTIYFAGWDETFAWEAWKSDGTPAGAARLTTTNGSANAAPSSFTAGPGGIYFRMSNAEERQRLYVSGGSPETTKIVASSLTADQRVENPLLALDGRLLCWVRGESGDPDEVWSITGPDAELTPNVPLLRNLATGKVNYGVWDGAAYLSSSGPPNAAMRFSDRDTELWRTDGSPAGTYEVKDINYRTLESLPQRFRPLGDRMAFTASSAEFGGELWTTDGTRSGTALLADLTPGIADSEMSAIEPFLSGLIFSLEVQDGTFALWYTDGTSEGTGPLGAAGAMPVFSRVGGLTVNGSQAFFEGQLPSGPRGFWVTDGTPGGTIELVAEQPRYSTGMTGRTFPSMGGATFFVTGAIGADRTLWRTDGTIDGTIAVETSESGASFISHFLFSAAGRLFYEGETPEDGKAVFATDGSPGAAVAVLSLEPGEGFANFVNQDVSELGGLAYFRVMESEGFDKLYRSDGTAPGTSVVESFKLVSDSIGYFNMSIYDGYLYFIAGTDALGLELWRTDGTAGVMPVTGSTPSAGASRPYTFTVLNDRVFYTDATSIGRSGGLGNEVWSVDAAGGMPRFEGEFHITYRIDDILALGDRILFQADDTIHGRELWAYSDDYIPPAADPNFDYVVDATDLQLIINDALGLFTGFDCDTTGDGSVNAADIQSVINEILAGQTGQVKSVERETGIGFTKQNRRDRHQGA